MCCLITILLLIGPRAAALLWAITDQARWQATFDNLIIPIMGILFLPWTTLAYVAVAAGGVEGIEWVWLIIAFLIDMGSSSGGAYKNRGRLNRGRA
ncbi:MAG: hypothetical protein J0M07_24920 [Anaerolineae bacterium]|jgi:hypothetical protein|uniref:hypothetical protein n=1 Tax=Candidatus Flexifilum breve TaxID=3140694 RepID=UPI001ACE251D|nr:hypothetical protein [Chloroflexota bacterium]MBK9746703.1 hypothetical protein [Chloroflexota bacterium]MBN8638580.1 hypothetical protein [Anaerolineae bacterium]